MISLVGDQIACDRLAPAQVGASMSARLRAAASSVGSSVVASPLSAGWISAATMTPVSRSTACSGLVAQTRRAVLHLGDLRVGIGRARPVLVRKLLALRFRSSRTRSSIVGVATPLSWAMRVSISPDTSRRSHAARWFAARRLASWSSPLALHRSALGDQPQNPAGRLSHGPRAASDFASSTCSQE